MGGRPCERRGFSQHRGVGCCTGRCPFGNSEEGGGQSGEALAEPEVLGAASERASHRVRPTTHVLSGRRVRGSSRRATVRPSVAPSWKVWRPSTTPVW